MTALRHTRFVTATHLLQLWRQPWWIAVTLVQPVWLLLFGSLFKVVADIPGFGSESYIEYLAPGIVVMTAFFSAGWSGMPVIEDLDRRDRPPARDADQPPCADRGPGRAELRDDRDPVVRNRRHRARRGRRVPERSPRRARAGGRGGADQRLLRGAVDQPWADGAQGGDADRDRDVPALRSRSCRRRSCSPA